MDSKETQILMGVLRAVEKECDRLAKDRYLGNVSANFYEYQAQDIMESLIRIVNSKADLIGKE